MEQNPDATPPGDQSVAGQQDESASPPPEQTQTDPNEGAQPVQTDEPEPDFTPNPVEDGADTDTNNDTGDMSDLPRESVEADENDTKSLG